MSQTPATHRRRPFERARVLLGLGGAIGILGCDKPVEPVEVDPPVPEEPLQEVVSAPEPMEIDPAEIEPIIDKSSKVTILGYHQFITSGTPGEMRIRSTKFKEQMLALREAEIPVISLSDYMAWRRGERAIPERCVVITIDDGYDDLHAEALPVFRELGYPFTFYIYTDFLGGAGRTLSDDEVRELIAAGGELGSHSISHDFLVRGRRSRGDAWLETELKGSKEALERRFGVEVTSFAYPYGEYNDEVAELAAGYGYTSAVTVNGAKAGFDTGAMELPRYIIHGNNDINWNAGTSFGGGGGLGDGNNLLAETPEGAQADEPPLRVYPKPGSVVADRLPTISADLSNLQGVIPETIEMRVSGFGEVPFVYDTERGVASWTVTRRLRTDEVDVRLRLRRSGEPSADHAAWSFRIDRNAFYLPDYEQHRVPKAVPLTPVPEAAAEPAPEPDARPARPARPLGA